MEKALQYHLLIDGRVQGVGYRYSTRWAAENLGLTGWVKNLADGRVEILAEGNEVALDQLVIWAKQGPRFAKVDHVVLERETTENPTFTQFNIL